MRYKKAPEIEKKIRLKDKFGIRSLRQVSSDYAHVLKHFGSGFQVNLSSLRHFRPDLALPALAGKIPEHNMAPICNLFDRTNGGRVYSQRVTRNTCRDFRNQTLSYDNHDGVDFVCPPGTKIAAAAPGVATLVRDRWYRGGLTLTIDHGAGVVTQYSHLSSVTVEIGQHVQRGQTVAISGISGLEMTTFFPWVPPHLHFMVWVNGKPVDPYLKAHELASSGTWEQRNFPVPGRPGDVDFPQPKVNVKLMSELIHECKDEGIRREITEVWDKPLSLAALLEDSFHHDEKAWPENYRDHCLRPVDDEEIILISLPLNWNTYEGAYFADPPGL